MAPVFDSAALLALGWRQGAILGPKIAGKARDYAPRRITVNDLAIIVVVSHDCDVLNHQLAKEPIVEVLSGNRELSASAGRPRITSFGRNPRKLRLLTVNVGEDECTLDFSVHDRWTIPREWLTEEPPADSLSHRDRRIMAEWLAGRYIRPGFPTAFDLRWRKEFGAWQKLVSKHSRLMRAVYLWLHSYDELPEDIPYRCHLILAHPPAAAGILNWSEKVRKVESDCLDFWSQFRPSIECDGVEALSTADLTLDAIQRYHKLDLNWVSFRDGTTSIPMALELTA